MWPSLLEPNQYLVIIGIGMQGMGCCEQHFVCCELYSRSRMHRGTQCHPRKAVITCGCDCCRGVEHHGLQGLPFAVVKGTLGVFGHPLGSLLGTAASLSGSIRTSLLGVDVLPPRLRPPRHVSAREPLSVYTYIDVSAPHRMPKHMCHCDLPYMQSRCIPGKRSDVQKVLCCVSQTFWSWMI